MAIQTIIEPTQEPVTLEQTKIVCRIDNTIEDTLVNGWIRAARERAEHIMKRSIMPQTLELALDAFPSDGDIELPMGKVASIESVKYINEAGAETTLSPSNYALDNYGITNWLLLADGATFPATANVANAVKVRYIAGYADIETVPQTIKQFIYANVLEAYERGDAGNKYDGLLDRYRNWAM